MNFNRVIITLCLLFLGHTAISYAAQISDADVARKIVAESVEEYLASGHPCACPYSTMKNGRACGARSAYSRPGGEAPLCYAKDVSSEMISQWRIAHSN